MNKFLCGLLALCCIGVSDAGTVTKTISESSVAVDYQEAPRVFIAWTNWGGGTSLWSIAADGRIMVRRTQEERFNYIENFFPNAIIHSYYFDHDYNLIIRYRLKL